MMAGDDGQGFKFKLLGDGMGPSDGRDGLQLGSVGGVIHNHVGQVVSAHDVALGMGRHHRLLAHVVVAPRHEPVQPGCMVPVQWACQQACHDPSQHLCTCQTSAQRLH